MKPSGQSRRSTTLLGDWYAAGVVLSRKQYVLCVSENARVPVLLPAAPYQSFPFRLITALELLLPDLGLAKSAVAWELAEMHPHSVARTESRSVLGSIRQFEIQLQVHDHLGRLIHDDPLGVSLWLADTISLILPEGTPRESALKLFEANNDLKR